MAFRDRAEAGKLLAQKLTVYQDRSDVVVLGLPRGGVPVAEQVALALRVPLDVFLVRKLGVPGNEELAMGAIADGVRVRNEEVVTGLGIEEEVFEQVARAEGRELARRERLYRHGRHAVAIAGKVAILIDDGLATGATMRAAVEALRAKRAAEVVVAVPIGAPETCQAFAHLVDEVICALTPHPFLAVGYWYQDFSQTTDEEVSAALERAADRRNARTSQEGIAR